MARAYDLAVIGGGVNGVGVARDAAGRGMSVYLCEMSDLAAGASSCSTKLIHGGLRYLERLDLRLVREALLERETLWRMAPHIVEPLRFVLPHRRGLRPAWVLRTGLFLYDHLAGRRLLPATRTVDLARDPLGEPLKRGFSRGFEYSDCRVDDVRLVALTALDAARHGARIETRTKAVAADRSAEGWSITLEDRRTGELKSISAKALVNAAGAWAPEILSSVTRSHVKAPVRLVQGSHVLVRRLYPHDQSYVLQNPDGRIVFVIPYECDFTLIGTTDVDYIGDPSLARATDEEIDYLCRAASVYFTNPVTRADIVWTYSGVRPLYGQRPEKAQAATRDYVLQLDEAVKGAPLVSIFGGKITTHRRLAEAALEKLSPHFPGLPGPWTSRSHLPGGAFPVDAGREVLNGLRDRYPFLSERTARRLACAYGLAAFAILRDAQSSADLGRDFGAGLTEVEVEHLMRNEWAIEPEDILWRRSKLGLFLKPEEVAGLARFMAEKLPAPRRSLSPATWTRAAAPPPAAGKS